MLQILENIEARWVYVEDIYVGTNLSANWATTIFIFLIFSPVASIVNSAKNVTYDLGGQNFNRK